MLLSGISVIVPVFNSEPGLAELNRRLSAVLSVMAVDFEIILVDDGSADQSWETISLLGSRFPEIVALRLGRNMGQHNALLCGIRAARFDTIVTLDDDLQNPPEEIPALIEELNSGYDVVYGSPDVQRHGVLRNLASRITKLTLRRSMGEGTAQHLSAFRVFRTRLRDSFDSYSNPFVSIDVLLTWGTTRFSWVRVRHDLRTFSESGYTVRKLHVHAFNMVTGFTTLPLQIASMFGFIFSAFGFLALGFVFIRYCFTEASVPGFTFVASALTLFAGVQLLCLGIMGEYLARIHSAASGRLPYTVDSKVEKLSAA
jgi:glycosyltransferase involved in cell wall biosynthesis